MISAIIPAAGSSRRMSSVINKQFISVAGQPVLARSLLSLKDFAQEFIIVARPGEEDMCREIASRCLEHFTVVTGGATRKDSVHSGVKVAKGELCLIHDGGRPLVDAELVKRVIDAAIIHGAAIPVIPITDTIKEVQGDFVKNTLKRDSLRAVQTPQVINRSLLLGAYEAIGDKDVTDDASLIEAMGHPVATVPGDSKNIKITSPEDLERANYILSGSAEMIRTGMGYDVHAFASGRDLILGGVKIPYEKGLVGHSDADVLVHAIMDALLGAVALGDIGKHFPDTDAKWKGADSCKLLAHVSELVARKGFCLGNLDAVVIAQKPKISPYIQEMREKIALTLNTDIEKINIKATTTEGLGFTGRGEGIAAQAVCLVEAPGFRR